MSAMSVAIKTPMQTRACPCGCVSGRHGAVEANAAPPMSRPTAASQFSPVAWQPRSTRALSIRAAAATETAAKTPETAKATAPVPAKKAQPPASYEAKYLQSRMETIKGHFPTAYTADDFLLRLEMALCAFGFNGDNSIGIVNLCRDEATNPLRQKIESIYPLVFNINGLGGGLTCGVTGMKAGLSHSPVFPANAAGRKRYIFFSCPHIAIDSKGNVGSMSRPGQQATNCACGAMLGALGQFNSEGLESYIKPDGVHDATDPEYSIFKQRLAARIQKEKKSLEDIDLAELTKICERQISSDLDFLISQAVDVKEADYAVITGVQVHNWGEKFDNGEPNLEIVAPTKMAVVINGEKTELDLASMPALTPRQISMLTGQQGLDTTSSVSAYVDGSTITDMNGKDTWSGAFAKSAEAGKQRETKFLEMLASNLGF